MGLGLKEKIKLTSLGLFDSPFSKYFLKEFLECNGCFGLLRKIKKESGASF